MKKQPENPSTDGKKLTMAQKMAEKAFQNPQIQQSWTVHEAAFGPILRPAFEEDPAARIHLTAALNHISRGELKQGMDKLAVVQKSCSSDADKAALLFCVGLCFERAGDKDRMLEFYAKAGEYHHNFYLPYLKLARAAHNDAVFALAEQYYRDGIRCLESTAGNQQESILASAYTNLASCLTMMHRFDEAEQALSASVQLLDSLPGRDAAAAILYAAKGDQEKAEKYVNLLEKQASEVAVQSLAVARKILAGEHPHFSPVHVDPEQAEAFWLWFAENEERMRDQLRTQEYEPVIQRLSERLTPLFPYMKRELDFGIMPEKDYFLLELADFYMTGLHCGYEDLLQSRPAELNDNWRFAIIH